MKLKSLVEVNLLWFCDTELKVFVRDKSGFLKASEAVALYGERQVRFFHDNVVFLL